MRAKPTEQLERARIRDGKMASTEADGMAGAFRFKDTVVVSSGHDTEYNWEHVSVSCATTTPTWTQMCYIKNMFWDEDEWVVQFHPAASDYVNVHPFCLHMWKPIGVDFPKPPAILVGPKS
jgi:hypothetical protein